MGTWLNHLAPARLILLGFAALMVVAAIAMARVRLNDQSMPASAPFSPRVLIAGLAVGVLTGFFEVDGGFLIVHALVLVLGLPMREAVGTSLLVIAINAGAALAGDRRYGPIDLGVTALFMLGCAEHAHGKPALDADRRGSSTARLCRNGRACRALHRGWHGTWPWLRLER